MSEKGAKGGEEMIRKEVQWFAKKMEEKLARNDYKSGWKGYDKDGKQNWKEGCSVEWLFFKLSEEIGELSKELRALLAGSKTDEFIILECADVANFAMMIADKFREERK